MITKLLKLNFSEERQKDDRSLLNFRSTSAAMMRIPTYRKFTFERKMEIVIEGQIESVKIEDLCLREGITLETFNKWTDQLLTGSEESLKLKKEHFDDDDKFNIVIEGKSGEKSIAEICRREGITHDTFLDWSKNFLELRNRGLRDYEEGSLSYIKNKELISNVDVFTYIENYLNFSDEELLIVRDEQDENFSHSDQIKNVVCLNKINDIRYINKYFEKINSKLDKGGIFVGCLETFTARRNKMTMNSIPLVNNVYFTLEFLWKRIIPKLSFAKKYYFDFTKGSDRLLSKAEGLGRLVSCGFRIMDYKSIDGLLYFIVKKVNEPKFDMSPSYGPLYKMPRLGKNGEIIGVYKFRTMHPYSEYLQDYILKANGYAESGKPAEDFRIPVWGKFMRRFWLDEIPQLINVLKGEMKLVGIRPVSARYFQDIPAEMQKLRLMQKPGCIPPYVALDREGNVMSVLQSEREYLEAKIRNPYTTDTKYFFKAIFNIIFRHKRSA